MTPNPSFELTRYGRRLNSNVRHLEDGKSMREIPESIPLLNEATDQSQGPTDNDALRVLKEQDQAVRIGPVGSIDWSKVSPQDAQRRAEVTKMLHAGCVRTANDFCNAALIFQHGEQVEDFQLAYSLASVSIKLDPSNKDARWLTAASWDRIMKAWGKPQWYGTQYTGPHPSGRKWQLYKVDEAAVTDAERNALGVPTVAEMRARVRRLNVSGRADR